MVKSKAIDIIRTFDEKEFKEFGKFINSTYFNSNSKVAELYSILKTNYPGFSRYSFTKENIYIKLFPRKKYNDGTMRKLLSGLQSLAEEYLSYSAFRNHHFSKKYFLLNKLDEKKLDVLFNQHLDEVLKIYNQERIFDDVYFKNNFEIYETLLSRLATKGKFNKDEEIKCFFYLISHCIILSLKMNQDLMVGAVANSFDYKNTLLFKFTEKFDLEGFLEEIRNFSPEFYPVLRIYYLNFLILVNQDNDDNYFWEMKKLVWENIHRFSRFEKYNLMLFLENCASIKIRDGKTEFIKHIHDIHKKMLEDNIYVSDDSSYLANIRFWKIVNSAYSMNEFEWAEKFIEEYSDRLEPENIEHMKNYSYAMLNLAKHEYDKALSFASRAKPLTFNIRYDLMVLKIKCYYELHLIEEMYYQLDSFKHLLKTDTSPDWAKKRFENFLQFFEKLLTLSENPSANGHDNDLFKKNLQESSEVFDKLWLMEKVNLL